MTPRWLVEPLAPGLQRGWRLDEILWQGDTGFQHVVIARTAQGIALFCDGERQSTELSQLVYHEALLVPALLLADRAERVLVIGSSEGVVSQLAVAAGARTVDHVDIDRECVRRCAELLPYGYTVAELAAAERGLGPVRVHYADGWEFLAGTVGSAGSVGSAGTVGSAGAGHDRYDVVVVDLPDERASEAQHNRLYGEEFLRRCASVLAAGGVVSCQAGCPTLWRNASLVRSWRRFRSVFGTVAYFGSDEQEWAFLSGRVDAVRDPTSAMVERLAQLPYRPVGIDATGLAAASVAPISIRLG